LSVADSGGASFLARADCTARNAAGTATARPRKEFCCSFADDPHAHPALNYGGAATRVCSSSRGLAQRDKIFVPVQLLAMYLGQLRVAGRHVQWET
jgi:hypothetical protein